MQHIFKIFSWILSITVSSVFNTDNMSVLFAASLLGIFHSFKHLWVLSFRIKLSTFQFLARYHHQMDFHSYLYGFLSKKMVTPCAFFVNFKLFFLSFHVFDRPPNRIRNCLTWSIFTVTFLLLHDMPNLSCGS